MEQSQARLAVNAAMDKWREMIEPDGKGWRALEVGIEGDERPSGNHRKFGNGNEWYTLDIQRFLDPSVAGDVRAMPFKRDSLDLVICSQVLEHVFDVGRAIASMWSSVKPEGYLIVDVPWMVPYHGVDGPGIEDYWRFSPPALDGLLKPFFGNRIVVDVGGHVTAALAKKDANGSDCSECRERGGCQGGVSRHCCRL